MSQYQLYHQGHGRSGGAENNNLLREVCQSILNLFVYQVGARAAGVPIVTCLCRVIRRRLLGMSHSLSPKQQQQQIKVSQFTYYS